MLPRVPARIVELACPSFGVLEAVNERSVRMLARMMMPALGWRRLLAAGHREVRANNVVARGRSSDMVHLSIRQTWLFVADPKM
jgi:hypothetical protein